MQNETNLKINSVTIQNMVNTYVLLATALTLGLRHGVDWDHVAALLDISGGTTRSKGAREPLRLCLFYALGHGFIVFALGLAAIGFTAILPSWIDDVMERVVGATLLALSGYLFWAVYNSAANPASFKLQSRLMLACEFLKKIMSQARLLSATDLTKVTAAGTVDSPKVEVAAGGAFSIGILHGLGAETGTQILLITAIGNAKSSNLSIGMLLAFIVGLIVSNSLIALLAIRGFECSINHRRLFISLGSSAAIFSLWLGLMFISGCSSNLPSIGMVK